MKARPARRTSLAYRVVELEEGLRTLLRVGDSLVLQARQRDRWHSAAIEAERLLKASAS